MGGVPQISSRIDIKRLPPLPKNPPFQYGGNTNDDLCQQHVDTDAETREDDQNSAKEDASPDCTDETKIQTKKSKNGQKKEGTEKVDAKDEGGTTDKETDEGSEQDSKENQDSDVSFQEDEDEEIDATENEEDWFEYIKRSTKEANEHMEKHNVKCWIEVHKRQKWRMARRIITLPAKKLNRRVFNWHPGLDNTIRARRQVGRPKRRWEDDLNEFMKTEEGHEKERYALKNNNSWMKEIEDYKKWKENEEKFSKIW